MKLKKYFILTRAGFIECLQYRLGMFSTIIGNLFYLIVMYFLWKAIYASADTDIVNGMTFLDTIIYLVLATAMFNFMEMYIVWEIGGSIQSGSISLYLMKPLEYRKYIFWENSGSLVSKFFFTFLPTIIVVTVITHGTIQFGINLFFFLVSLIMAMYINYCIDFFVGTLCLYTESIWGINIMKQMIVMLLSGATIPIAFFPNNLKTIVYYLPFQSIYNAPLSVLLDENLKTQTLMTIFGLQLFWCIVMTLFSRYFWKVSSKQITVNGG